MWATRPRDEVYAAIFIDAIVVKIRDGRVANRPVCAAIGVTLRGEQDVLGLWAGTGGEGAKFWMSVLTDLRNRGVKATFFVVCDGLKGLSEVVGTASHATWLYDAGWSLVEIAARRGHSKATVPTKHSARRVVASVVAR